MKKDRVTFAAILHLAELYQEQYREAGLCLSPEQNDICFRDFVAQYYLAVRLGREPSPKIETSLLEHCEDESLIW